MRIAYYRSVRDSDDGCGIYQCLHCGQTWEWRGGSAPVRFCLFCGQAIERLETRDQDTPRWKHDLEKRYGDDWPEKRGQMWQEEWEKRDRRQPPYWVIEERCFILRDGEDERLLNDWKHRSNLLGCGYKHPVSARCLPGVAPQAARGGRARHAGRPGLRSRRPFHACLPSRVPAAEGDAMTTYCAVWSDTSKVIFRHRAPRASPRLAAQGNHRRCTRRQHARPCR